jgi:hypothetical protein
LFEGQVRIIKSIDTDLTRKPHINIIILAVFAVMSLITRIFEIPFSYGVSFTLGNIFIFIILRYYGLLAAFLSAVTINVLYWLLFKGDIFTIFFVLEVLVVGILWRNKQRNLFLIDAFYWGVIGAPASILVFYMTRESMGVQGFLFVANISVNGLLNIIITDIILSYVPIQRIFGLKEKNWLICTK